MKDYNNLRTSCQYIPMEDLQGVREWLGEGTVIKVKNRAIYPVLTYFS